MIANPPGKLRHCPVVVYGRSAIFAAKSFDSFAGFAGFLAVEKKDGPAAIEELKRSQLIRRIRGAESAFPGTAAGHNRRPDTSLVVVLKVVDKMLSDRIRLADHFKIVLVQKAEPIDVFQAVVGLVVIHGVETRVDQFLLLLHWIATSDPWIGLCEEVRAAALPSAIDEVSPGLCRNVMCKVAAKSIHTLALPESEYRIDAAPQPWVRIVAARARHEIETVVQLDGFVPVRR